MSQVVTIPSTLFPDLEVQAGVRMNTSDGAILEADIYRPREAGPLPVLLMRQPYGRDIASTVTYAPPAVLARAGYQVIIQDVRGRGGSTGQFDAFQQEATDGAETVEWAAQLPGSNGRVGMYGFSYQGYTQLAAARSRPQALQALAPHMAAFDLYSGWFYPDGVLRLASTLGWATQMLREDARRAGEFELAQSLEETWKNPGRLATMLPTRSVSPVTDPRASAYARDWLEHEQYDAYWEALDLLNEPALDDIPMFHLGGWYDFYLKGTLDGYRAMAKRAPQRQFGVFGPWVHLPWGTGSPGGSFGPKAALDTDHLLLRWFDRHLKDDATAEPETSGALTYVLHEDTWLRSSQWPPAEAQAQTWYLSSEGRANASKGDGVLQSVTGRAGYDSFHYDPEVPVLAPGGSMAGSVTWGPVDLAPSQAGNNLLVYTGPATEAPWRLVGPARLLLQVSSTAEETLFVARLSRVTRNGTAQFLSLGAARYAAAKTEDGQIPLVIALTDTACLFEVGDRLRLDISSSAFPLLIRHPNTSQNPAAVSTPGEFQRAWQVVRHGADTSSRLEIQTMLP